MCITSYKSYHTLLNSIYNISKHRNLLEDNRLPGIFDRFTAICSDEILQEAFPVHQVIIVFDRNYALS
jgi:hypothetical protein